ncbi:hypothetical protein EUGRSUZ_E00916 [Eucalyptus grandis]|uniref:Uncharacterized protein n=2 Tax=Eucalyptus grandis TaxID=71139 RepID=A0ACC3KT49_EUCGR|nr:hypothetical protein EUGRSUZ_E00916 [Eucalyptus grandis]
MQTLDESTIKLLENVAQLRDIAYDAEDVIERYILRVMLKKGQNIIKAYACFVAKCTCMQVHVVGTEIEGLKSRISNLRISMQCHEIQSVKKDERYAIQCISSDLQHIEVQFFLLVNILRYTL